MRCSRLGPVDLPGSVQCCARLLAWLVGWLVGWLLAFLQTRQAAVHLCAEVHRWAPGILNKPLEASLREAQLKEVADASTAKKSTNAPLVPTVHLRRDRERMAAAGSDGGGGGGKAAAAFDPSELMEEVDLQKALRKTEYSTLKTSKVSGRANKRARACVRVLSVCVRLLSVCVRLRVVVDGDEKGIVRVRR